MKKGGRLILGDKKEIGSLSAKSVVLIHKPLTKGSLNRFDEQLNLFSKKHLNIKE
jgi:hypothetical protein